jgi:hypothetical protein
MSVQKAAQAAESQTLNSVSRAQTNFHTDRKGSWTVTFGPKRSCSIGLSGSKPSEVGAEEHYSEEARQSVICLAEVVDIWAVRPLVTRNQRQYAHCFAGLGAGVVKYEKNRFSCETAVPRIPAPVGQILASLRLPGSSTGTQHYEEVSVPAGE